MTSLRPVLPTRHAILATLLAFGSLVLPLTAGTVLLTQPAAAQSEDEKPKRKTKRTQALDTAVYESVSKAAESYDLGETEEAYKQINKVLGKKNLGDYEKAFIYTTLGGWAYQEDKPNKAIEYFEQVAQQSEAPESLLNQAIFYLSQINFVVENYRESIDYMNQYLKVAESPGLTPYNFLAQAHFQLEEFDKTIEYANLLINTAREQNLEIRENWYLLLRSSYFSKEDYPKVAEIMEVLVINWNKPDYWKSLAAIYGQLGREKDQLALLEIAYKQGYYDDEKELTTLAQYYLYHNVPIKAAWILNKGFKDGIVGSTADNHELLGRAYLLAQERAEAVNHFTKAAEMSEGERASELWVQVAQAQVEQYNWKETADALQAAFDASDEVPNVNNNRMLLGQAYLQTYQFDKAERTFNAITDRDMRAQIRRWKNFIAAEKKRVAYLDENLGTNYLNQD